jgi:hypothetical protein
METLVAGRVQGEQPAVAAFETAATFQGADRAGKVTDNPGQVTPRLRRERRGKPVLQIRGR